MFMLNNKLFLYFFGMGFLISQYHSTNKQQTEEQFDNLKKEKIMTFESLLNRINKRFISMKFISVLDIYIFINKVSQK